MKDPEYRGWAAAVLPVACCLVAATMLAQTAPHLQRINNAQGANWSPQDQPKAETAGQTGVLVLNVFGQQPSTPLDRQALLKLEDPLNQTVTWQVTEAESRGTFNDLAFGNYKVEVSAAGYLSANKDVRVASPKPVLFDIVLRVDPGGVNLEIPYYALSDTARKEANRAFLALKSRNYKKAEKYLTEVYESAPASSQLNFLMGYLYFQQKDFEKASNYFGTATTLNPHDAAAWMLHGRTFLERKDYGAAVTALEQAISEDEGNWLAHDLLADAYLRSENYEKARAEAQAAIDKGQKDAVSAWLILGESLMKLGLRQEAAQALDAFLLASPRDQVAEDVRRLIADAHASGSSAPPVSDTTTADARLASIDPLQAIAPPGLPAKSWQPPTIEQSKIPLVRNISCPTERIIEQTGKNVEELINSVGRIAAIEDLFHESLDASGIPLRSETRKYNYVAAISEPQPGALVVEEYRNEKSLPAEYPDQIVSNGFAALALVFHPHMRDNFDFRCEGLGDWHGQAGWVMSFRERDDRTSGMHAYKVNNLVFPVRLRGRAWVTADKFHIVRIESEIMSPVPQIALLSEHWAVEYGPVRFEKKNTSLWLPKGAEIYFDFQRHHYHRRHSFDHYMLFSVDVNEKRKEPGTEPAEPPDLPNHGDRMFIEQGADQRTPPVFAPSSNASRAIASAVF